MRRLIVALLLAGVYNGHPARAQSAVEHALLEATRAETRTTCSGTVMVPESTGDERMALPVPTAESAMPRIFPDCVPARRIAQPSSQARSLERPSEAPVVVPRRAPQPDGGAKPRPR